MKLGTGPVVIGGDGVIRGWSVGLPGMRVGGVRKLTVPLEDAYGSRGAGSAIPPGATLYFEVELLTIH